MLTHLEDKALLLNISLLVRTERQTTAKVLDYLSEIDRRRLWVKEGYSSLHDFCVRYLNYSEGEANRRIQAARITLKVEELKPLLISNELSLSAISLVAPHITKENAKELIPKIKNQSIRVIEKVLFEHFPEARKKRRFLEIELDEELEKLLETAKQKAMEKDPTQLLKKVLKVYVTPLGNGKTRQTATRNHTNYVQAAMRRHLFQRDHHQCTFVGSSGVRCNQTAHLQVDHVLPWAMGGSSKDSSNLRVLCKMHNLYKAAVDFPNFRHSQSRVPPVPLPAKSSQM